MVLATSLSRFRRYGEAKRALRSARRLIPVEHVSRLWTSFGEVCDEQGDRGRALRWFRKSDAAEETTDNLVQLGCTLVELERVDEAEECFRRAVRVASSCPSEAHLNLGRLRMRAGLYAEARECLDEALRLDAEYASAERLREECVLAQEWVARRRPSRLD